VGAFDVVRPRLTLGASFAGALCAWSALALEPHRTIDASRALDAGALPGAPSDPPMTSTPPDPPPLVERSQWVFDLRWDRGDVWLLDVTKLELRAPQATPRAIGRFAVELFEGPTVIERARFDFPLLGSGDGPLAGKLRTRIGVLFPATKRGTRLELCDRATNRRWSLAWPPPHGGMHGVGDAGALEPFRDGGRRAE
jgi:hypothetical protein